MVGDSSEPGDPNLDFPPIGTNINSNTFSPAGSYCMGRKDYVGMTLVFNILNMVFAFGAFARGIRIAYQLRVIGALKNNAGGHTIVCAALTPFFTFLVLLCYFGVLTDMDRDYFLYDTIRPAAFGIAAIFNVTAALKVTFMWMDVVDKASNGSKKALLKKIEHLHNGMIVITG